MSSRRLRETSYIVLGLLDQVGPATPYDLKRLSQVSTVNFWSVPHTQLYTECARLAKEGLLDEQREQTGRRRRVYRLTDRGREALERWRSEPTGELNEVRDIGTLKLFFGGDPARLAAAQLAAHRRQLEVYEQLRADLCTQGAEASRGWLLALESGIGHEREFVRFWSGLSEAGESLGRTGTVEPPGPTGTVEPQGATGTVEPQGATGTVEPQGATGIVEPQGATGTAEPLSGTDPPR